MKWIANAIGLSIILGVMAWTYYQRGFRAGKMIARQDVIDLLKECRKEAK